MKDDLGDRIKKYENVTKTFLPKRTYSILRLDGRSFHSYTKKLKKPFDSELSDDLDDSTISLLKEIGGAKFAYCQSDEISILSCDVENINTQQWFDGNIQKICSVSSSVLTAEFNKRRIISKLGTPDTMSYENGHCVTETLYYYDPGHIQSILSFESFANFDCRVFSIPDRIEVMNYFRWRNQDCKRNSISMAAYSMFSHKSLQGKNSLEKIQMIYNNTGKSYEENYSQKERFGRFIVKIDDQWQSLPAWDFSNDEGKLLKYIPEYGY